MTGSPNSRAPERTILLVDDSEGAILSLEVAFGEIPGIRVAFVSSGAEAVRRLERGGQSISAVVTDIRMPGMDGFALIRHIRADRKHFSIPIIVVSGDTDPETPARTSQLGANAFFAKPFSPVAVRKTLEKLLYAAETK
ncbi:MAG TPA: response regulator [Bryobacteraceae bacterium]|nr:response regulator [Bryobacteraceae bacterium]